jgi:Spy/CpxP family protein refolding chaperone
MKSRILLVSLTLALFTLQVVAQGPGRGPMGQSPMMPLMRIVEELKLTDDQKKEVEKIRFDTQKQMIAQMSKLANARVEYQQLTRADNLDKAAMEKKINEITQLASQTATLMLNQWFAVNKLLTAEQQKVWKKALNVGGMFRERFGRGTMGMGLRKGMRDRMMMHRGMMRDDD